jgi:hypothetical protein
MGVARHGVDDHGHNIVDLLGELMLGQNYKRD